MLAPVPLYSNSTQNLIQMRKKLLFFSNEGLRVCFSCSNMKHCCFVFLQTTLAALLLSYTCPKTPRLLSSREPLELCRPSARSSFRAHLEKKVRSLDLHFSHLLEWTITYPLLWQNLFELARALSLTFKPINYLVC